MTEYVRWVLLMGNALLNPNIRTIVGLGNPGEEYKLTRHNVGFMIIDRLARQKRVDFKRMSKGYKSASFNLAGRNIRLIKPLTYMNNSGKAVSGAVERFGFSSTEMLVIADDVNLPLGKIRIRSKGSDGGHKGLKSVMDYLRTADFPRFRVGIGAPSKYMALEDYVLSPFTKEELEVLENVITHSVELIFRILIGNINSVNGTYTFPSIVEN